MQAYGKILLFGIVALEKGKITKYNVGKCNFFNHKKLLLRCFLPGLHLR